MNKPTKVEAMELFIIESLLKGKNVVIPDFGHLEVKSLGNRHTVLFKSTDNSDSFLRIMSVVGEKEKNDTNDLHSIISIPLKEEKIVNLPKVGVFRPVKRESGEISVSFILSSYLRKLLNKEEEKEEIKETGRIIDARESKKETQEVQKDEIKTKSVHESETGGKLVVAESVKGNDITFKNRTNLPQRKSIAKVGDQIVPQDEVQEKSRSRNLSGTLLFIAIVFTIIVIVVSTIISNRNKKADGQVEIIIPSESISLPALAESHYGHAAFWIYIYDANSDKLNSPINIPQNISLVIPDLRAEYDVDVTDSMEIHRANIMADIILKEKTGTK